MSQRTVRHLILAGFVALACGLAFALSRSADARLQWLSLGLGYASLALLLLTLLIGPWTALRGRRLPVSTMFRRDLGIWAAVSGLFHVVVGLQSHFGGRIGRYFFLDKPAGAPDLSLFGLSNWLGLVAALILVGLLLLSNNLALRALGANGWKFWQRFSYLLAVLVLLHTFGYQMVQNRAPAAVVVTVVAAATVVLLRCLGLVRLRQRSAGGRPSAVTTVGSGRIEGQPSA